MLKTKIQEQVGAFEVKQPEISFADTAKLNQATEEISAWRIPEYVQDYLIYYKTYCFENPICASLYLVLIILVSALAAYKCKGCLKRICNRRRNRRRRKPRSHYYYLKKNGEDKEENNVAESLIDN